jgi:hypothetical protein
MRCTNAARAQHARQGCAPPGLSSRKQPAHSPTRLADDAHARSADQEAIRHARVPKDFDVGQRTADVACVERSHSRLRSNGGRHTRPSLCVTCSTYDWESLPRVIAASTAADASANRSTSSSAARARRIPSEVPRPMASAAVIACCSVPASAVLHAACRLRTTARIRRMPSTWNK